MQGAGCRVQGAGCRVKGPGCDPLDDAELAINIAIMQRRV